MVRQRSANRVQLIFSPPDVGEYHVSIATVAVANQGLTMSAGAPPFSLHVDDCGCAIQEDIFVIGTNAAAFAGLIEVMETGAVGEHHTDKE